MAWRSCVSVCVCEGCVCVHANWLKEGVVWPIAKGA